jgi:hypothetical protein
MSLFGYARRPQTGSPVSEKTPLLDNTISREATSFLMLSGSKSLP